MQDTPYYERFRGFASTSELTLIVPQTDPVKTVSNFQSTPVAQLFEGQYSEHDEEDDDESDGYHLEEYNWSSLRPARWSAEPESGSQAHFEHEQEIKTNFQPDPVPAPITDFEQEHIDFVPSSSPVYSNFVNYNPMKRPRMPKPEIADFRKGLERFTSSFKVDPSAPPSTSPTSSNHSPKTRTIAPRKNPTATTSVLPRIRLKKVAGSVTATLVFRDDDNNSTSGATATIQIPTTTENELSVMESDTSQDQDIPDLVMENEKEVEQGERSTGK